VRYDSKRWRWVRQLSLAGAVAGGVAMGGGGSILARAQDDPAANIVTEESLPPVGEAVEVPAEAGPESAEIIDPPAEAETTTQRTVVQSVVLHGTLDDAVRERVRKELEESQLPADVVEQVLASLGNRSPESAGQFQFQMKRTDDGGVELSQHRVDGVVNVLMRSRFMIGLSVAPLEGEVGQGITLGPGHGLIVTGITPNSAAAAAGLEVGDIVHSANAIPLRRPEDLVRAVEQAGASERPVRLEGFRRSGEGMTLEVKPQTRPDDPRFEAIIQGFPVGPHFRGGFPGAAGDYPHAPGAPPFPPPPGGAPAPRGFVVPRDQPGPAWGGVGEMKQQLEQLRQELAQLRSRGDVSGDAARDAENREQRMQRWADQKQEQQQRQMVENEQRQQEKLNRVEQELREKQRQLARQQEELEDQRRQLEREREALEQAKRALEMERRQIGEELERARTAATHSQSREEMARVKQELTELRRMVEALRDK
jgi:hypothetical protein